MNPNAKHLLIILAVCAVVAIVYHRLPTTYFCAYDDFLEVHRAAFEDTREPGRVFTTTHFTSYKYRPLNRGINLLTYWLGDGSATYFRTRNVLCHLLNVLLIYVIAWLLFGSRWISGTSALLFGLHPLANQAVAGAVMTNTAAHSMFLLATVSFLISLKQGKAWFIWLGLALLLGWLSLLTYEAAIVAYPLMVSYLLLRFLFQRRWPVSRAYTVVLALGSVLFLAAYYLIHARFVPYSASRAIPSLVVMLKNSAMYVGALLLPVDSVLAHTWFGTPLPSELHLSAGSPLLWALALVALVVMALLVWVLLRLKKRGFQDPHWPEMFYVLVSIIAVLSPLIIFVDKASETYLYLAVGFVTIFFAAILRKILKPLENKSGRVAFIVVVAALLVSFASATWVRNSLVRRCGTTANQIVGTLQRDDLKNGVWFIWLAPVPGEPETNRYGMYGWRGIDTVGVTAVQAAAQLANKNEMLAASVLTPDGLARGCRNSRDVCFAVHANGKVDEVKPAVASDR